MKLISFSSGQFLDALSTGNDNGNATVRNLLSKQSNKLFVVFGK